MPSIDIIFNSLAEPQTFIWVITLLGLFIGSFLNVVIHRLPIMMESSWNSQIAEYRNEPQPEQIRYNLVVPPSACPNCKRPIRALENIPVISYLIQRGRCCGCQQKISPRYPLVELLTAALSFAVVSHFGPGWPCVLALIFCWALIALTFIDFDTTLLPDDITLPLLWLGLLASLGETFTTPPEAIIGAAAGYLSLWSIYWIFKLLTGKEGMGYGDFKLLAAIGAWLGWKILPMVILLSSLVGAIIGVSIMIITRRGRDVPIPFGPYLAIAALIALFFSKELTTQYLLLFRY